MYTLTTTGNGLTAEIFCNGESIVFLQGYDAAQLIDERDECKTDAQVQYLLSQYNIQ